MHALFKTEPCTLKTRDHPAHAYNKVIRHSEGGQGRKDSLGSSCSREWGGKSIPAEGTASAQEAATSLVSPVLSPLNKLWFGSSVVHWKELKQS